MFTTKIRITIAVAAAIAVAAVGASSAFALAPRGHGIFPIVHRTVVAVPLMPAPNQAKGNGVPGYDDETCAGLLSVYQTLSLVSEVAKNAGDFNTANAMQLTAEATYTQLSGNCALS